MTGLKSKSVTIYERKGKIFICSLSKTTKNAWIVYGPVYQESNYDPVKIGEKIRECLSESGEQVPHPTDFSSLFRSVLELSGLKSYAAFAKSAKSVTILLENDTIYLTPLRHVGRGGYLAKSDPSEIPVGPDEALGKAALAALSQAE